MTDMEMGFDVMEEDQLNFCTSSGSMFRMNLQEKYVSLLPMNLYAVD